MSTPAEDFAASLQANTREVVYGAEDLVHHLAIALIAQGHVLLQGVPGLGKTLLAKTLATQLGGDFKRIQCTADLMPTDMTGIHVYNPEKHEFVFMPGPLFGDVVLVDEINRTGPKTQSALLQAMEERHITIDRNDYPLPDEFFVIATQNPHEFEGTYPLPESQLDRFLFRLDMGYLDAQAEQQVLRAYDQPGGRHRGTPPTARLDHDLLKHAREQAGALHVSDAVYRYVGEIAAASRAHTAVTLGLSSRGALGLMRAARVEAALHGGEFATPDDVKAVAAPVMRHRLILNTDAMLEGVEAASVVDELLQSVDVPRD